MNAEHELDTDLRDALQSATLFGRIEFRDVTLRDAVDYLYGRAFDLGLRHLTIRLCLWLGDLSPQRKISLVLEDLPLGHCLHYVAEQAGLQMILCDEFIVCLAEPMLPLVYAPQLEPQSGVSLN